MARPSTKDELLVASARNYERLQKFIVSMSEAELGTPFDFSSDAKKTEAHWARDRNLRDVLVHLYEWHRLLLGWVSANTVGQRRPFLLAPYTWKTYGKMNVGFWEKHQSTPLEEAKRLLEASHGAVMALAEGLSGDELFGRGHFDWTGTTTLGSYFASATSSHYDWALKKLRAHRKNCEGR